ncbi:hypothetical protein D3Y59_01435 [Hymenobacter oligotrophus]|uniref:Uncharacterized protein n=1 Tax=Hymenobacter oligotrophus TaxID=2319843 RepID=A0A3B7QVK6_9BACT|nr:hypothetical protein [Hymenobacter oligotrophus]AYA35824.1 hypothetical protein D3Y59_01435 [Hymenobacter oligotrophus]
MDISTLDFQQARIKQVLFKSRLRSVLYGVREAEASLFDIRQNPLRQWLDAVVKPKYQGTEVFEIERVLQRMLDAGQALVAQYKRGQIEEARAGLGQIDQHSERIEQLLQTLERNGRSA